MSVVFVNVCIHSLEQCVSVIPLRCVLSSMKWCAPVLLGESAMNVENVSVMSILAALPVNAAILVVTAVDKEAVLVV